MPAFATETLIAFGSLFSIVDPFSALPLFLALVGREPREVQSGVALRASLTCFFILTAFGAAGTLIFHFFGITLPAFKIAGGILLFGTGLEMIRAKHVEKRSTTEEESEPHDDVAIIPIGLPLLSGPGAIAAVMVLGAKAQGMTAKVGVETAVLAVSLSSFLVLRSSTFFARILRRTGINIIGRLMGLLLGAIAIQFVIDGVTEAFPRLAGTLPGQLARRHAPPRPAKPARGSTPRGRFARWRLFASGRPRDYVPRLRMFSWAIKKVFGTAHERTIRRMRPKIEAINALEDKMKALSDAELQRQTVVFKEKIDNGATVDDILVEAFAACREASRRVLKMRHYDVQLIGGMVLNSGSIAEMRTGEGKTLVATLPCYLNALEGKGVHVVTVNDYLAKRDCEWMSRLYNWMGLTTGVVVNQQDDEEKRLAYRADITYGQNNEFGFDYLRDNMKFSALEYAQRPLHYAIVDEVDSILIDEARTPLIISGQGEKSSDKYKVVNEMVPKLRRDEHYVVDEKAFSVTLTDDGVERSEKLLGLSNLYDVHNLEILHILNQCLRAHALYKRDQHYMVTPDGKVVIIDEFTGRVLAGRRWSDGLHQAVEAKENVRIQEESRTMATITFQNLFRIYKKLSGMTGTADTEAGEFHSTYKLDVTIIPTNRAIKRVDHEDVVYKTEREKFTAVVNELMEFHSQGRPVLVGTTSVEKSAALAAMLKKRKVPHSVLNAKHHENEAFVVAQAGRKGAITVSTNMAGRGTDILLGGNPEMIAKAQFREQNRIPEAEPEEFAKLLEELEASCAAERKEVLEAGGLHIVGTERHESRRIDNQLRGRAGRQGDPGSSRFYLSLEDDLMRIFAGDKVKSLMERLGMPDDEPIEHPWVTKSVENAQQKVEERNFDVRKHLLEYDDVMNSQRKTIYALRHQVLIGRYETEELDEDGRPTGKNRKFKSKKEIKESVIPVIGRLLADLCVPELPTYDDEGKPKTLARADFEGVTRFRDVEMVQRRIYETFGTVLEVEGREDDVLGIHDELVKVVPLALTEQRERLFDLLDRVLVAVVEETCPANKPPDDWDYKSLADGVRDIVGVDPPDEIEELADQEAIARALYDLAEKEYLLREKEMGYELALRVFRHVYLEEIDRAWVEHLTNMEHLRDGIGLRGYGQRDPKQEYKKEGYNLFVTMVAAISNSVVKKLMHVQVQRPEEEAAIEERDRRRHEAALADAMAVHGEQSEPALVDPGPPPEPEPPAAAEEARIAKDDECPCGSGKPFRQCHGAPDEEASL